MTRMDSVRAATGTAKESVRHAAEVMAPHAGSARDSAVHYAQEAGARLGPKVSHAAQQARHSAREGYTYYVGPRVAQARESLPAEVDKAATRAAQRTRSTARQAARYAGPRIEQAVADARAAAGPASEEAAARGAAAMAALRGQVTPDEIRKLSRRRDRRARTGRVVRRVTVVAVLAGAGYAVWRWWDKQANPDWLVEPPPATEVGDRTPLATVNGSENALDPEVRAKQADADAESSSEDRREP
ncbi:DUF5324 family protein [Streptomyces sp. NPDC048172]|uniref:DUF5324 family protein n=1 Tax=Streptomyces sp. NPDC048172 TaxID=3365505 RepID=UPI0037103360